jgi:hypothetical protein
VLVRTHIQLDSLRRYALCVHWFFDASHSLNFNHRRQSFRGFAPQGIELVSKNEDFGFRRSPRPEQPDQGAPDRLLIDRTINPFAGVSQLFWVCGRDWAPLNVAVGLVMVRRADFEHDVNVNLLPPYGLDPG